MDLDVVEVEGGGIADDSLMAINNGTATRRANSRTRRKICAFPLEERGFLFRPPAPREIGFGELRLAYIRNTRQTEISMRRCVANNAMWYLL